jgi:hypothetical protein
MLFVYHVASLAKIGVEATFSAKMLRETLARSGSHSPRRAQFYDVSPWVLYALSRVDRIY